ncbi:MAG: hypothetical protein ACP5E5_10840 [Acidobacteriaceae bacterium]
MKHTATAAAVMPDYPAVFAGGTTPSTLPPRHLTGAMTKSSATLQEFARLDIPCGA